MTRPAVFLDRDGTLVEEVPYLRDPERLALLPGVGALATLAAAGYALVMVTNQAGVARGLYDEAAAAAVHRRPAGLLAGEGVELRDHRAGGRAAPPGVAAVTGLAAASRRCWRAGPCRAAKRPGPLRP